MLKKLFWIAVALFLAAAILYGCSSSGGGSQTRRWPNVPDMTNWSKEDGVRMAGLVSTSTILLSDGRYRMFYLVAGQGIGSAISDDGITFTAEAGLRVAAGASGTTYDAGVKDPDMVDEGTFWRMYYTAVGEDDKHRVMSARSLDGYTFSIEAGVRIDYAASYNELADVPSVVKVNDSSYRMYFVYDWYGDNTIKGASSSDGLNWTIHTVNGLCDDCMDPDAFLDGSGNIVLYFACPRYTQGMGNLEIYKATSSDGISFEVVGLALRPTKEVEGSSIGDPDVLQLSDGRYRVYYYGLQGSETYNILSASAESF